ncbi:MAG TPA: NADH-quinone oxidoreductase subunit NuoH [Terriglobia bacterium]|nr:NADH-quinone oxidoreductase subunit NuoH [Terriglobia bacterium]
MAQVLQFVAAHPLIAALIKILIVFLVLSIIIMYIVYVERKVLAFMQARLGPMRVGPWGALQAIADPLKLMLKEDIIPSQADRTVFMIAPVIGVMAALSVFAVIPFAGNFYIADVNIGILLILAVSSLGIYGIILGGWASNSHYPLLGALRSAAQLVSYEVAAGLAVVGVLLFSNSLSMITIVTRQQEMGVWNVIVQPVAFFVYLVAAVAESNRAPFDLPEAESELTAGFHTEYSGFRWALYFMAEYAAMILVSCIGVTLFFGGWLRPFESVHWLAGAPSAAGAMGGLLYYAPPAGLLGFAAFIIWLARRTPIPSERLFWMGFAAACVLLGALVAYPPLLHAVQGVFWFSVKVAIFLYAFIWYRGTFPRYRYDQLMKLGWRWMIPLALANLIVTAVLRYWWIATHTGTPTALILR